MCAGHRSTPGDRERVRDVCQAAGAPIGKASVNTVIAGILYAGLDLRQSRVRKGRRDLGRQRDRALPRRSDGAGSAGRRGDPRVGGRRPAQAVSGGWRPCPAGSDVAGSDGVRGPMLGSGGVRMPCEARRHRLSCFGIECREVLCCRYGWRTGHGPGNRRCAALRCSSSVLAGTPTGWWWGAVGVVGR